MSTHKTQFVAVTEFEVWPNPNPGVQLTFYNIYLFYIFYNTTDSFI